MATRKNPLVAGEPKKVSNASYRNDPLYAYGKAFVEAANNILTSEHYDLFSEPQRAVRSNSQVKEILREFFCENFVDEADETKTPEQIEDEKESVKEMFEQDMDAMLENNVQQDYSPMVGMAAPIHKLILMNNVFAQGNGIQSVTATSPSFTISLERRILVKPNGDEIDMWLDQNQITDAIDSTAPSVQFELELPFKEEDKDFVQELGGGQLDHLSMTTHISGIFVPNVYYAEGDHLPDVDGWYTTKGEVATAETAGLKDTWFRVDIPFAPNYGGPNRIERALSRPVSIKYKKNADGDIEVIKDTLFASLNKDKISIVTIANKISKVRLSAKLDTSNAMLEECSVKWKVDTDYVEIPESTPINTTVSPEEVKDIAALYDANQTTKIISNTKTALSEYRDMKIYRYIKETHEQGDERSSFEGQFDFAVPEGYALDWVTHRQATFMDYLDDLVTKMLQVLNDPNMTVSIYGDPRIIRKITPKDYTYQTPASIGPVTLDYANTIVNTTDKRVYNFVGSDKMRNTKEMLILLNPKNSERICIRIYNYQMYISNEIRNSANPALPAIHSFDRFRMYKMFPVTANLEILNPSGLRK